MNGLLGAGNLGMIVCLYGETCAAFVAPIVSDLQEAVAGLGGELAALSVEAAVAHPDRWREVERLYVLPFDVPRQAERAGAASASALIAALFPRAALINSPVVHELCWDKIELAQRLRTRGVPMPDTLITDLPDEAHAFVREHEYAILKEPRSCGGLGHVVVMADADGTLAGEVRGRRYVLELQAAGPGRRLADGVLSVPPPFYLQRLVAGTGRRGVLEPAQVLRAYVVNDQIMFWTERYREKLNRPADFLISVALGAKYRFLREASSEAQKLALRTAEVLGVQIGVVDLIRTGGEGPYVLEVDTDGPYLFIDRQFKQLPEFRTPFDLDHFVAEALLAPPAEPPVRRLSV